MKLLKKIFFVLFVSIISISAIQAQFLKRLKERVQEAAEEAVIMKTEEKVAEKTGEGIDKLFSLNAKKMHGNKMAGASGVDPSILPDSYDFEWKYTMQMQTQKGSFIMNYFLKPEAKYFGVEPDLQQENAEGSMFMVMDVERNINTVFMEMEDSKMASPMSLPDEMLTENEDEDLTEEYTFVEIGTKEILGYQCHGFKMENDEIEMIIYAAMDAPVSFTQIYGVDTKKMPKGFNPKWLDKAENSLVMELEYTDKKKEKNKATMTCIALNEEAFSINKNDYQFMNLTMPTGEEE